MPKPKSLTLRGLLRKFPRLPRRSNCLTNLVCPQCGQRDSFNIDMVATIRLRDSGTDEHGDTEWDGDSHCGCPKCGHTGRAKQFTFVGLDEALAAQFHPEQS